MWCSISYGGVENSRARLLVLVFGHGLTIEVNGQTLRFKKAVIATGGQAALPPIPGLKDAPYHTNGNIFNLTKQPKQMCVIGGGPIGLELAQLGRSRRWATVDNNGRKKLEKLLGAAKPYALGVLGGLALAALARR